MKTSPPAFLCPQCLRRVGEGLPGHAHGCMAGPEAPPWWKGPLVALDFETTGTDPREARIVSYATAFVLPDGELWEKYSIRGIVDPGIEVPEQAAAIHGLTTEEVRRRGEDPVYALEAIIVQLNLADQLGIPLVIFNAPYDWTLLHCEIRRRPVERFQVPELKIIDPLVIDRAVDKYRKGKRTLERAVEVWAPDFQLEAHDAHGDCEGAVQVARALAAKFPQVGELTPAELHQVQAGWYRAWVEDFNAYRARKGQDPIPDGGWPLDL